MDSSMFATFSDDGTTKIWDMSKLEGRNHVNKARLTYSSQGELLLHVHKSYTNVGQKQSLSSVNILQCQAISTRSSYIRSTVVYQARPYTLSEIQ